MGRLRSAIAAGGCAAALAAGGASAALAISAHAPATQVSAIAGAPALDSRAPGGAPLGVLTGLPQSGSRLGNPGAAVTLTLYGDLECPFCKRLVLGPTFSELIAHDVRTGRVQIHYVAFQTATTDRSVFIAQQVAALAAGRQHRFWQYTMLFLSHQGAEGTSYVTENFLEDLAHHVTGLNLARWQTARHDRRLAVQVKAQDRSANRQGIIGTPTLVFHGPRGVKTVQAPFPNYRQLERTIKAVS